MINPSKPVTLRAEFCPYPIPTEATITEEKKRQIKNDWLTTCVIDPYERFLKTEAMPQFIGVSAIFDWMKENKFIKHTEDDRRALLQKATGAVKMRAATQARQDSSARKLLKELADGGAQNEIELEYRRAAVEDCFRRMKNKNFNLRQFINRPEK